VAANAPTSPTRLRCPRCQRLNVRREGSAHSSLDWFVCLSCSNVWSSAVRIPSDPSEMLAGVNHILIVDDDDAILTVVAAYLHDCRVSVCLDPHDALAVVQHEPIDLLIVDFLMPLMGGDEVVRRARKVRTNLPALIITGYASAVRTIGIERVPTLEKPFTRSELLRAIALARALDSGRR
jgi:CheY-like chemotaxis protein